MKITVVLKFLLLSTLVLLVSSCQNEPCLAKWMYLNNYDNFMKRIEQKEADFSENDWKKMDEKYESFSTVCKEKFWEDLSREEKDRVIENNMRYLILRVKSKFSGSLFKDLESEINSFVKGLDKEKMDQNADKIKKSWDDLKKNHAGELENAFSEMGKSLEKIGKEIGESAEK